MTEVEMKEIITTQREKILMLEQRIQELESKTLIQEHTGKVVAQVEDLMFSGLR